MGKKRQHTTPPKQPSFKSTPFSALKGTVVIPAAPPPKPENPPLVTRQVADADTDDSLFFQAMGGVRRLDAESLPPLPGARPRATERPPAPSRYLGEIDQEEAETFNQAIGQLRLDVTFADKLPEDEEFKPLGANRLRQLKRGIIRLDRQLDLHGLTRDEALGAIPRFLRNARVHGEKAVLVITGKGINSPGEPVLQQAVAAWLRDAGREFVLEYAPAPRELGGSGAFVVFLRE